MTIINTVITVKCFCFRYECLFPFHPSLLFFFSRLLCKLFHITEDRFRKLLCCTNFIFTNCEPKWEVIMLEITFQNVQLVDLSVYILF